MKTLPKLFAILISILMLSVTVAGAQNTFVLITLNPDNSFVYKESGTNNYIEYNIINQTYYTSKTGTIYVNTITSNASSSLNVFNEGQTLTTNTGYSVTFDSLFNSTQVNTAKGNFLVRGEEYRYITVKNPSGVLIYDNVLARLDYGYNSADRAITILTGNLEADTFSLKVSAPINSVSNTSYLYLDFEANVIYAPSVSFNTTYKGLTTIVKNITEQFEITNARAYYFVNNDLAFYDFFSIGNFYNVYVFAQNIGLPIYILKYNTGTVIYPYQPFYKINPQSNSIISSVFQLNHYSWQKSKTKTTDFPFFFFILATFILVIKRKNKI